MKNFVIGFIVMYSSLFAVDVRVTLPSNAYKYYPIVTDEVYDYGLGLIEPWYIGSLIEVESCIHLNHSKCWNPVVQYKTAREHAKGLGQFTIAYNKDGSVRFDALVDLKRAYPFQLSKLTWDNILVKPELQIRAIVLKQVQNIKSLPNHILKLDKVLLADSAYNGGIGSMNKDRMVCGLAKNCDPNIWFKNVESTCTKNTKLKIGGRTMCEINRDHVKDVYNRAPKYEKLTPFKIDAPLSFGEF